MKTLSLKKTKLKQLNTKTMLQTRETAMIGAGTKLDGLPVEQEGGNNATKISCIRICPVSN